MSTFDINKIHPKDELVVLLRQGGVDLSDGHEYAPGDAVWFTVKYVEHFLGTFEFLSGDRDEHGTIDIENHGSDYAVYSFEDYILKMHPGLQSSYEYCEIVPVSWTEHWGSNKNLRIKTPSREDHPDAVLARAKLRLVPNLSN
jgi:hypothetical protein